MKWINQSCKLYRLQGHYFNMQPNVFKKDLPNSIGLNTEVKYLEFKTVTQSKLNSDFSK